MRKLAGATAGPPPRFGPLHAPPLCRSLPLGDETVDKTTPLIALTAPGNS